MKLTLGCTTRPFADFSFADTCKRIASSGFTDVAVFSDVGLAAESSSELALQVRKTALDAGLKPSMLLAHAELDRPDSEKRYMRLIDHAATLGAQWLLDLGVGDRELLDSYISLMRRAASYAQKAGIEISAKPHGGITTTTDDLIAVHNGVNHPAFGICYDPGNIIYYTKGVERPETNIHKIAPLATSGIIKDCALLDGKPEVMITPGEGLVDFKSVLEGLVQGGFSGPLFLECLGGKTIEEITSNAKKTHIFMSEILDTIVP